MTSLLGRLLPLFTGAWRVEDLFTETVAHLFERRPDICLGWLDSLALITPVSEEDRRYIRATTQKSFVALEEHGRGSRPDLIVEVHHPVADELESSPDLVMIESKISSWEGQDQLKRYAEHLDKMTGMKRTLVYMTRAYDPKNREEILAETRSVEFCQLRWHDFYNFLQAIEKDALVEEVMSFMEEQGMSRSHQISTTDLIALSGVPRAFEIFDETLDDEVKEELEAFTRNKASIYQAQQQVRRYGRYIVLAKLHGSDPYCFVGYNMNIAESYPEAIVQLEAQPRAAQRDNIVAAMKKIVLRENWESYNLGDPTAWCGIVCAKSIASFLPEDDHIAAIKRFFIESIQQLREELTKFKKDHPDFPWNGE